MLETLIFIVFPFCMVFAALSDLLTMKIANSLCLLLAATFLLAAPLSGMDWTAYGWHLAAGFLCLAVTFGLFAIGGMGGGDAKLIAATALWMGLGSPLVQYLIYSTLAGGVLTLAILAYRKSPLSVYTGHYAFLRHLADPKKGIPYGVALAAGGLLAFPASPLTIWALEQSATH